MRLLICLSILVATLSFHDHNFHPTPATIRAEARRAAYNEFDDLITDIQSFRKTLIRMKEDYVHLINQSSFKGELNRQIWEDTYGFDYRKRYDNYLIVQ
jgi:hypothetical protein